MRETDTVHLCFVQKVCVNLSLSNLFLNQSSSYDSSDSGNRWEVHCCSSLAMKSVGIVFFAEKKTQESLLVVAVAKDMHMCGRQRPLVPGQVVRTVGP